MKIYFSRQEGQEKTIRILRDTGASQSLIVKDYLLAGAKPDANKTVTIRGIEGKPRNIP